MLTGNISYLTQITITEKTKISLCKCRLLYLCTLWYFNEVNFESVKEYAITNFNIDTDLLAGAIEDQFWCIFTTLQEKE